MNRVIIIGVITILLLGFAGSAYAAYNGVGLITSGTDTTSTSSRGVFFVFPGGGPGSGK